MALGNQIKKYRQRTGLTLEALEEISGVDVGTISALERRDSRKTKYARAIARAFGLTVEQLEDEEREHEVRLAQPGAAAPAVFPPPPTPHPEAANSAWPFSVSLERVNSLPPFELGRLDGFLTAMVEAYEASVKKTGFA